MKKSTCSPLIVLFALMLAGCGDGRSNSQEGEPLTASEYQMQLATAVRQAAPLFVSIEALGDQTIQDCSRVADDFAKSGSEVLSLLAEMNPPGQAADAHAQFIASGKELVAEVPRLAEGKSCGQRLENAVRATDSWAEAEEALTTIEDAGFAVLGR